MKTAEELKQEFLKMWMPKKRYHQISTMPEHLNYLLEAYAALAVAEATKQRDELLEALIEAKKTIKVWHELMEKNPKDGKAWEYYQASPEMKKINAAIKSTEATKNQGVFTDMCMENIVLKTIKK